MPIVWQQLRQSWYCEEQSIWVGQPGVLPQQKFGVQEEYSL